MAISDKLTYLNTTKEKIRTALNNGGANVLSSATFRSYAQTLQDLIAYTIAHPLDTWEAFPKVTGEGISITLNQTYASRIGLDLKGNTSQTGTPTPSSPIPVNVVSGDNEIVVNGKNFLNNINFVKGRLDNGVLGYANNTTNLITTQDSVEFTTNANYRGVTSDYIVVQPSTDYVYQQKNSLSSLYLSLACYDSNKTYLGNPTITNIGSSSRKLTMLANTKFFRINIQLNTAGTIKLEELMLFKGSTATTYEPYSGNTYNIDLPVENLLNTTYQANQTRGGITFTKNSDGSWTASGTAGTGAYCNLYVGENTNMVPNNQTYTFSSGINNSNIGVAIYEYINGAWSEKKNEYSQNVNYTPSGTQTGQLFRIFVKYGADLTTPITFYPMVEKGSKQNTFTPYGTTPIELCKIGNYQDYFYKDNGNWYKYGAIGKVVLNGSENWSFEASSTSPSSRTTVSLTNVVHYLSSNGSYLSNYFINGSTTSNRIVLTNSVVYLSLDDTVTNVVSSDTNAQKRDKIKVWLSTYNTDLYYVLATPTTTQITDSTLLSQLEAIYNAVSQNGQTNISQINNDLPFIISASALKNDL